MTRFIHSDYPIGKRMWYWVFHRERRITPFLVIFWDSEEGCSREIVLVMRVVLVGFSFYSLAFHFKATISACLWWYRRFEVEFFLSARYYQGHRYFIAELVTHLKMEHFYTFIFINRFRLDVSKTRLWENIYMTRYCHNLLKTKHSCLSSFM